MKTPKCGNRKCRVSTGIHEGLTFGSGELDEWGYWEKPCRICAENWDIEQPATRERLTNEIVASGNSREDAMKYVQEHHDWLYLPGWPFESKEPTHANPTR